jgi:L-cysteine desulfidase
MVLRRGEPSVKIPDISASAGQMVLKGFTIGPSRQLGVILSRPRVAPDKHNRNNGKLVAWSYCAKLSVGMQFSEYLEKEWKPALGCTEPAAIAYAAATAASFLGEEVEKIRLVCDGRMYKNCYAVGIPHSGHRIGIRWAVAIGSCLSNPSAKLECFKGIGEDVLAHAESLLAQGAILVEVDRTRTELYIFCEIEGGGSRATATIEGEHTNLTRVEKDGTLVQSKGNRIAASMPSIRAEVAALSFAELLHIARALTNEDREALRRGIDLNIAIAQYGLSLFPERFISGKNDALSVISQLVCAGVYARMWGEDYSVMALAGSGNKGIVCTVPLSFWGARLGLTQERIDEALAFSCLITSATTHFLGTLSAVCGCSNAAGIGLAAGLVVLEGGGPEQVSLAINNMVGNVTGMICDGAKIGCALKTMTSVDAAFRSASLALAGVGIPYSDGILGADGLASLKNLGRIATRGMTSVDNEILDIMGEKLSAS